MVEINKAARALKIKIAYFGPAIGGKTTNLNVLYQNALRPRRGDFISVNSKQDRTILCDLLPLRTGGFCGFDVNLQLLAVPGQSIYLVSRRAVLKGCDSVVFVANSASDRWHENIQSFGELQAHLRAQQLNLATIPLVFQYNKRDLPDVLEIDALNRGLNQRGAPFFAAVARKGEGVLETLSAILNLTLEDLSRRHRELELPLGQTVATWTAQAIRSVFGRDSLSGVVLEEEPHVEGLRVPGTSRAVKVRIPMPEETARPSGGAADLRSAESLAESYAEASAELGLAMSDLRLERDRAETRLAEIQAALEAVEAGSAKLDLEARALRIVEILVVAAAASSATLLLTLGEAREVLVLPPLAADPLSRSPWGASFIRSLGDLREAQLHVADEDPGLAEVFAKAEPPFRALVVIPLHSSERLLGLAFLYYLPHAALPPQDTLTHLGMLARVLAGSLEATAARQAGADARRLRTLSRASAAAMVSVLTRLPGRALRREPLELEDLLGPLRAPGVTVEIEPGTPAIEGDPALLRFALTTLIHRCEAAALEREESPSIRVRAALEDIVVRVHVISGTGAEGQRAAREKLHPDSDAEATAINAVLALHDGYFVVYEGDVVDTHFTLQFSASPVAPRS